MRYASALALGLLYAAAATPLQAADMPKGALCALSDIQECDTANACERVTAEDIAAPRFFRIELAQKTLQGVGPRARDRVSKIESVHQNGDVVFAQGVDDGAKSDRGALGWLLALTPADGSMRLTVTGGDTTFVADGECLIDK
jgi:hypothetical protein